MEPSAPLSTDFFLKVTLSSAEQLKVPLRRGACLAFDSGLPDGERQLLVNSPVSHLFTAFWPPLIYLPVG